MSGLSCAQAMQRFFTYLDRALAGEALEELETHLEVCLACCDKLTCSRDLDAFVKQRLGTGVPVGLETRIRRALATGS